MTKLLDAEPIAIYYQHMRDGRKYICMGDDCPLCGIGDEPRYRIVAAPDD